MKSVSLNIISLNKGIAMIMYDDRCCGELKSQIRL